MSVEPHTLPRDFFDKVSNQAFEELFGSPPPGGEQELGGEDQKNILLRAAIVIAHIPGRALRRSVMALTTADWAKIGRQTLSLVKLFMLGFGIGFLTVFLFTVLFSVAPILGWLFLTAALAQVIATTWGAILPNNRRYILA